MPHQVNALKYCLTVVVVLLSALSAHTGYLVFLVLWYAHARSLCPAPMVCV